MFSSFDSNDQQERRGMGAKMLIYSFNSKKGHYSIYINARV